MEEGRDRRTGRGKIKTAGGEVGVEREREEGRRIGREMGNRRKGKRNTRSTNFCCGLHICSLMRFVKNHIFTYSRDSCEK